MEERKNVCKNREQVCRMGAILERYSPNLKLTVNKEEGTIWISVKSYSVSIKFDYQEPFWYDHFDSSCESDEIAERCGELFFESIGIEEELNSQYMSDENLEMEVKEFGRRLDAGVYDEGNQAGGCIERVFRGILYIFLMLGFAVFSTIIAYM